MGAIYANAIFTISATSAVDLHSGLFKSSQRFIQDCVLRNDGPMSLVVRSQLTDIEAIDLMFEDGVERAPLSRRGWVF